MQQCVNATHRQRQNYKFTNKVGSNGSFTIVPETRLVFTREKPDTIDHSKSRALIHPYHADRFCSEKSTWLCQFFFSRKEKVVRIYLRACLNALRKAFSSKSLEIFKSACAQTLNLSLVQSFKQTKHFF